LKGSYGRHESFRTRDLGDRIGDHCRALIAKAAHKSSQDVAASIRTAGSKFPGVTGKIAFHIHDNKVDKPMAILEIVRGKPTFKAWVSP